VTAPRFAEQLNEQVGHEFAAHQQYVACATHYVKREQNGAGPDPTAPAMAGA
jgi:ferritin